MKTILTTLILSATAAYLLSVGGGVSAPSATADTGGTYVSAGADYAEWIPKLNPGEAIPPGSIVGVFGGKVSKRTNRADQVLAISNFPAVLGNQIDDHMERSHAKVAFLGQVDVLVVGVVRPGDYILASGDQDGTGRPVRPRDLTAEDLPAVLGRSMALSGESGYKVIKVSIGLGPTEIRDVVMSHEGRLRAIEEKLGIAPVMEGFASVE